MAVLRYTAAARGDIADVTLNIAVQSGSRKIAENFRNQIHQKCRYLASLPGQMGRPRSELRPDLRSAAFKNHVIFFRYHGEAFEVVNVLEGHRDIGEFFAESDP